MFPVLMLEINEVPWRLVDKYLDHPRLPNFSRFFRSSRQWTSFAADSGELSPWVTWPTLHRGLHNSEHRVANLGQNPDTYCGSTIWEDIRAQGHSIGICGSLQSWPPIDPGPGGFYLPDTFAQDEQCVPAYLSPIQKFNLGQVRQNARVVNSRLPAASDALVAAQAAFRSGVRLRTVSAIAKQLMAERFDRSLVGRRPEFQAHIFWDIFRRLFRPDSPPALSTFFTNHVAGIMHRYWRDVFPEDFDHSDVPGDTGKSRAHLMESALVALDGMLRDAMSWQANNPDLRIIFASSMGQGPVYREGFEGKALLVNDVTRLLAMCSLNEGQYKVNMAMVPQIAVTVPDVQKRAEVTRILEAAHPEGFPGEQFIHVNEIGHSLSITVKPPRLEAITPGRLVIGQQSTTLGDSGLQLIDVEPGTAYHIPEGTLALYTGSRIDPSEDSRSIVDSRQIKPWIKQLVQHGEAELISA